MNPKKTKTKGTCESEIQDAIIDFLKIRDWLVKSTHGNAYQHGFPDLYCAHYSYGQRWVEVKCPDKYSFTPAQQEFFPLLSAKRIGIWIMVAATQEEYDKIVTGPPNWAYYLNKQTRAFRG